MAFSKTPQTSTYQTKEISLLNEWDSRDASNTKDNSAINCFYEIIQNKKTGDKKHQVVKRDGTVAYGFTSPSSTIRGIHYWKDQDKLFVATSDDITVVTASTGATITTLNTVFGTTTGDVGFCEFLYDTNNVKVVATDGTTLVTIDSSNTVVTCVDADLPTPHIPVPVFLDGYLFLIKSSTADIYNSDLNDPVSWTAGDFITAEMSADKLSTISKINNYIIVFGTDSIEYFFDAANASGSPLQRYEPPIRNIGYVTGLSKWNNKLLFVGTGATSGQQIYLLEDLKIEPIGTPPGRRALEAFTTTAHASTTFAAVASWGGHDFYVLTLDTKTYTLDLENKLWTRIAFQANGNFPIKHSVSVPITGAGIVSLCTLSNSTALYYFSSSVYRDAGTNFTVTIVTDREDFQTHRVKTNSRVLVIGDTTSASATLTLQFSDDDFTTWSTARNIDMGSAYPMLYQLGQFRDRAFKLTFAANYPLRLQHLELDLNMGQA